MEDRITGGNSKRRVRQRQEQANDRQELRWNRTPEEQLEVLNQKLGKDVGAVKERTSLLKSILVEIHKEEAKIAKKAKKAKKAKPSPNEVKKHRKQQSVS